MHQISKHILSVECSSMSFVEEFQSVAADLMKKEFYPKLERLLDKYSKEGYIWSIDRIEIDLPLLSQKNWKTELIEKTLEQIELFLASGNKNFSRIENEQKSDSSSLGILVSDEKYAELLFFEYLKQGTFSQNSTFRTIDDIERYLTQKTLLAERKDILKENLIMLFAEYPKSLLRFVHTVSEKTKNIIEKEIKGFTSGFSIFQHQVKYDKRFFYSLQDYKFWLEFLDWILFLFNNNKTSQSSLLTGFRDSSVQYFGLDSERMDKLFELFVASDKENGITTEQIRLIEEFQISLQKSFLNDKSVTENLKKTDSVSDELEKEESNTDSESETISYERFDLEQVEDKQNAEDISNFSLNNSVYIQNSGLVIIHPFLIHLFERLKLYKDKEWTSNRNHHKAILISQYLVTGQTLFFENELVLNKIICGLAPDSVINTRIKLSKKDIAEADAMLESVIAYWKVLKNTSTDGLRETFLNRDGKLVFKDNGKLELWVEQKGVDILMSHIPWGIGMVKTPWMKNFLECNWN